MRRSTLVRYGIVKAVAADEPQAGDGIVKMLLKHQQKITAEELRRYLRASEKVYDLFKFGLSYVVVIHGRYLVSSKNSQNNVKYPSFVLL